MKACITGSFTIASDANVVASASSLSYSASLLSPASLLFPEADPYESPPVFWLFEYIEAKEDLESDLLNFIFLALF